MICIYIIYDIHNIYPQLALFAINQQGSAIINQWRCPISIGNNQSLDPP